MRRFVHVRMYSFAVVMHFLNSWF